MNYESLSIEELRSAIRERDQQLRDQIAKNDGYVKTLAANVKTLAANVKEICELKEQLAHEKESHAATTRTWESRERHCGLLATELKETKEQLAQAQAANTEAIWLVNNIKREDLDWSKRRSLFTQENWPSMSQRLEHLDSLREGWLSPDEAKRLESCISICEAKNEELAQQQKRLEAQLHDASTFGKNEESPASSTTLPKLRRCCVKQCNSPLRICMSVQTIGANAATPSSRNKRTRCDMPMKPVIVLPLRCAKLLTSNCANDLDLPHR